VTPFVLFKNLFGRISKKSLNKVFLSRSEWIAATPLTLWDPIIH
jgi:hypothetical protein